MRFLGPISLALLSAVSLSCAGGFPEAYSRILEAYGSSSIFSQSGGGQSVSARIPFSIGVASNVYGTGQWDNSYEFRSLLTQDVTGYLLGSDGNETVPMLSSWFTVAGSKNIWAGDGLIVAAGYNGSFYAADVDGNVRSAVKSSKASTYGLGRLGAGSYLRVDWLMTDAFGVRLRNEFTKALYFADDELAPLVMMADAEIFHAGGLFAGADYYRDFTGIDLNSARFDFKLGYRFRFPRM
jgi:hypothetical protein